MNDNDKEEKQGEDTMTMVVVGLVNNFLGLYFKPITHVKNMWFLD